MQDATRVGHDDTSLGLYFHLPFCERVCPYCDFAVIAARSLSPERGADYRELLLRELSQRSASFAGRSLRTIYFGGGTPSMFPPDEVATLIDAVRDTFSGSPGEVTLEANPSRAEGARFRRFREAGVTRLSLGVQSFSDVTLKRLGRAQTSVDVRTALDTARDAGFEELSVDLIFAAPGQRVADLECELDRLAEWSPDHVSLYELTIESGTPFSLAEQRHQLDRASEDEIADMFLLVGERLAAMGLARYEVSNYARAGHESQHNQRYWRRQPVLGLGVGAWSLDPPTAAAPFGRRPGNPRDLTSYRAQVLAAPGSGAVAFEARCPPLRPAQARAEAVFLALRTREGVLAGRFETEFGSAPRGFFGEEIQRFVEEGLLEEDLAGNLRMSERGVLLADFVASAFV